MLTLPRSSFRVAIEEGIIAAGRYMSARDANALVRVGKTAEKVGTNWHGCPATLAGLYVEAANPMDQEQPSLGVAAFVNFYDAAIIHQVRLIHGRKNVMPFLSQRDFMVVG